MARKLGRPFVYQSDEERPVTISVRLPRNLHDRLQRYAYIHRQSISELVKDGLDIRLEQSADPRDQSLETYYDNSVLQDLVRPLYQVDEHIPFDEDCTPAGVPLEVPRADLLYDSNSVIPEQSQARPGRPAGSMRQRILGLLAAHAEGLRAEEIRVHLAATRPIGDTMQGMRRAGLVETQGTGRSLRYVIAARK